MFNKLFFRTFAIITPLTVLPQQTDKIGLESGFVFNQYQPKEKLLIKNNSPLNYFIKVEYCGKTFTKNKWSLFLPFGISYAYYSVDYSPTSTSGLQSFYNHNLYHNFSLFMGPQIQYQTKQQRYCAALLINNQYLSTRIFGLVKVKGRLWLGPIFEMFYYDIIYAFDEYRNSKYIPNYQRGNIFGINGNAFRYNAGVKIQLDLKY